MRIMIVTSVLVIFMLTFSCPVYGAQEQYYTVAENFLKYIGSQAKIVSEQEIRTNLLLPSEEKKSIGWLIKLDPKGYLLLSASTNIMPVKAYSLSDNFTNLPEAYKSFLKKELELRIRRQKEDTVLRSTMSIAGENQAKKAWNFLLNYEPGITLQSYAPGTNLLTSTWNQGAPFNFFLPTIDGQNVLTGCVNTAVAQIMRYHKHPAQGRGVVSFKWNEKKLQAILNRPYYWENMPSDIHKWSPKFKKDEVALLLRDIAILNQTSFDLKNSATYFHDQAFAKHFAYSTDIKNISNNDPEFFNILKGEIDQKRPVLLSLPGHTVVADGYREDSVGKWFHLNMGWGGYEDNYYNLENSIKTSQYEFSANFDIYYNIRPCSGDDCVSPETITEDVPPKIMNNFEDLVLNSSLENKVRIRIDARDPNPEKITLGIDNSNPSALNCTLEDNVLTLQPRPNSSGQAAQVRLTASSGNKYTQKAFKVLLYSDKVNYGKNYNVNGRFSSQEDIDSFLAYLDGNCSISGDRGYSNQAFYIQVEDQEGDVVAGFSNSSIERSFHPSLYTIKASLKGKSGYYYPINEYPNYTLRFYCPQSAITTNQIADLLTIDLSGSYPLLDLNQDSRLTLKDLILSLQVLSDIDIPDFNFEDDINGDNRIGLDESVYILKKIQSGL